MKIRKLKMKDAPLMLEWMHDKAVTENLKKDFSIMTIEDAKGFIRNSVKVNSDSIHMAICSDKDEYMGTVSLKNINDKKAEFGIAIRKSAMGKGYSSFGMEEIIQYGFEKKELQEIVWCVDPINTRAVRFYDKNGYKRVTSLDIIPRSILDRYSEEEVNRYIWYMIKPKKEELSIK